ncbi:MAG: hypothetical protein J6I53_09180 [Treponema sp.]|nr:hypothetical protein [Treponema sp.]
MKKLKKILASLMAMSTLLFFSCKTNDDDGGGSSSSSLEVSPGTTSEIDPVVVAAQELAVSVDSSENDYVLVFYADGLSTYTDKTAYMWVTGGSGSTSSVPFTDGKQGSYKFGYMILHDGTSIASGLPSEVGEAILEKKDVNLIVKNTGSSWSWQTPDLILPTSSGNKHYLVLGSKTSKENAEIYTLTSSLVPTITSASMESSTEMKISLSVKLGLQGHADSNGFIVKDESGNSVEIADVKNYEYKSSSDRSHNFSDTLYLTLSNKINFSKIYYISREGFGPEGGLKVSTANGLKVSLSDYVYDKDDLGLTFNADGKVTFKTWTPVASSVTLLLFASSSDLETPSKEIPMTIDSGTGLCSVTTDVTGFKYYKYRITNNGTTNDVCDIYAKAASADSVASQIVDINSDTDAIPTGYTNDTAYGTKNSYYNPFGNSGSETKKYMDAVIYEMHIRDWSRLEVTDSTGKFLDIANGTKVINHIKNLGVTHVQILPMFDYAQKNDDDEYNWGYNPYHYNVPEGRYVKDMTDGTDAVKQMRSMIAAFHDAGIAVNMDVVYNHTSGTGLGSLYDMTIPYYYYRLDSAGNYSNGSGCGNETDSSAPMFRKYMIDSLKHWMLDYHINGFRFDLMGLHEADAMKEIYKALSEIDPNVMVYGEPWTGGTSPVVDGAGKANINSCADETYSSNGVACFNDDFRNAIKGAEYPAFSSGECSAYSKSTSNVIIKGLLNKCFSATLGRSINYCECHDNLTLSDKLALVMNGETSATSGNWVGTSSDKSDIINYGKQNELKKRDMLAASFMFLTPGTPFINGGQEFLRSKNGDENSYISSDDINEIKQDYIDEYADVTLYYKGLIALRKAYPDAFCYNISPEATRIADGLIKLDLGDFIVFFNSNNATTSIGEDYQVEGYTVEISTGEVVIAGSTTTAPSVESLSALIIKK